MKTLIKNEFIKFMRIGAKSTRKSRTSSIGSYLLVMILIGFIFAVMFYNMFSAIFPTFIGSGIGWMGHAYAVIVALFFAIIGSVFMSQSQLYRAKDNDLLLSLPIPPSQILFCRMLPLYVQNFYYCFIILLPAYIAYGICAGITALSLIFFIIALIVIPFFSLTLCCLLGMVVAWIATRVKHANIVSVILSLLFFAAYFIVYMQFNNILTALMQSGEQTASGIKTFAYPLYLAGRMFEGDLVGAAVTVLICGGLFALLYLLLNKTYIGIITRSHARAKSVYREKKIKKTSVWNVLIGKESKRFFRSTAYLINCGLGVVILFVAAIALLIFGGKITNAAMASMPGFIPYLAPLACAIICMTSSMGGISAPSVSLEGKSLYILQSLPVEGWKPLFAKMFFHVMFNAPVAVVCGLVAAIVFKASAISTIMLIVMPVAVNFFFGALGLIFNLKKPMLNWQNETVVIKQSISVLLFVLSVMVILGALIGLFFAARHIMSVDIYLIVCFLVISLWSAAAVLWLKKRGAKIWENL